MNVEFSASVEGYGTRFIRLTVNEVTTVPGPDIWHGPDKVERSMTAQLDTEQVKALMADCEAILKQQGH